MKPSSRPPRTPSRLSDSAHHQFNMYALAASAAGVSLLALAQPSEARIVYTKAHQVIGINGVYPLDLNHDGIVDFLIEDTPVGQLLAQPAVGNAVEGIKYVADALKKGAGIGPCQRFSGNIYPGMIMACIYSSEGSFWLGGPWVNVTNRYLGLRFQINGKNHYGWARLSTQAEGLQITATLTGYAYETIVNKEIVAGQTSGDDATPGLDPTDSSPGPAAPVIKPELQATPVPLGQLALGARGVALWRRP